MVSVTRAAARTGASLAPEHRRLTGANIAVLPDFTTSDVRPFTPVVADAVRSAASALPKNSIDFMLVYKANANGFPGSRGSFGTDPANACVGAETTCDLYIWNDLTGTFNNTVGSPWSNDVINACQADSTAESIGVFIQANHRMITGLFGQSLTDRVTGLPLPGKYSVQRAYSVMKFEPRPPQVSGVVQCRRV